jgi:hypothetical protein
LVRQPIIQRPKASKGHGHLVRNSIRSNRNSLAGATDRRGGFGSATLPAILGAYLDQVPERVILSQLNRQARRAVRKGRDVQTEASHAACIAAEKGFIRFCQRKLKTPDTLVSRWQPGTHCFLYESYAPTRDQCACHDLYPLSCNHSSTLFL